MSDSTDAAAANAPVTLTKAPAGTAATTTVAASRGRPTPTAAAVPNVPLTTTVKAAVAAVIGYVVFGLLRAVALQGSTAQLKVWLIYLNDKAGKKKIADFDAAKIDAALHAQRVGALQVGIAVGVAMLVLAFMLRRPKQATIARWALIFLLIVTFPMSSGPFAVVPQKHLPASVSIPWVLGGVAWIGIVLLLLIPQSSVYFRACKQAVNPGGTVPRPGFGALFAARGGAAAAGGARTAPTRPTRATRASATRPASDAASSEGRSKAKVRSDEAAVARGAELARSRAKASKSRRSDG